MDSGKTVEQTQSLHGNGSKSNFGLSDSEYPRCAEHSKSVGGMDLDLWANNIVGDADKYYLHNAKRTFSLLASKDTKSLKWILLNADEKAKQSCVEAMGGPYIPGVAFTFDSYNQTRKVFGKPSVK
jgi:hypothetical protein